MFTHNPDVIVARPHRRTARVVAAVALLALLGGCAQLRSQTVSSSKPVSIFPAQNAGAEQAFVNAINRVRAGRHLPALAVRSDLVNKARYWAVWMSLGNCAGSALICHSQLSGGISARWSWLAENVGVASPRSNVAGLESAFEHSAEHFANMVAPQAKAIGVGVAYAGNNIYVAEEFMDPM